jgi:DNA-binding MarR family transcriptional regulator
VTRYRAITALTGLIIGVLTVVVPPGHPAGAHAAVLPTLTNIRSGTSPRLGRRHRSGDAGVSSGRQIAAAPGPVGYALAQASRAHRRETQRWLAQVGLHLGQDLLIVDIHQHPDTTQAQLVARVGIDQPAAARAITRLQRAGFVERVPDPHNRRIIRLRLTDAGLTVVNNITAAWTATEKQVTSGLTLREAHQLTRLLNKIHDSLT